MAVITTRAGEQRRCGFTNVCYTIALLQNESLTDNGISRLVGIPVPVHHLMLESQQVIRSLIETDTATVELSNRVASASPFCTARSVRISAQ